MTFSLSPTGNPPCGQRRLGEHLGRLLEARRGDELSDCTAAFVMPSSWVLQVAGVGGM